MKNSRKAGRIGRASGPVLLLLLVVASLTEVGSDTARASVPGAAVHAVAPSSEITPGMARAEFDTLDLQLD